MIKGIVLKTILIESISATARFGFDVDVEKNRDEILPVDSNNIRIHHGYIGAVWLLFEPKSEWAWALVISDIIHHVLLYVINGDPQFT